MARIDEKLNNIFNDDDVDDILGTVKVKTPTRRAPNTQIEKNFAEVLAFFEKHGHLPVQDSEDSSEAGLWAKFDGIRIREDFRALVSHMDTYGLLGMKVDDDHSRIFEEAAPDIDLDEIKTNGNKIKPILIVSSKEALSEAQLKYKDKIFAIENELETKLLTLYQDAVKPLRETLSNITHGMSVEVFNLTGAEEAGGDVPSRLKSTAEALVETATKLESLAENIGSAVTHIEKEASEYRIAAKNDKDLVESPVFLNECYPDNPRPEKNKKPDTLEEVMSLDDIFSDEDFDDLLGDEEDSESNSILGGRRAIKASERENAEQTNRVPCASFENYQERFEQYKQAMEDGKLVVSSNRHETLSSGDLFLWDGLIALLSGESIEGDVKKHTGKRLHVVFSNGTEAWLREGSIKRSMYAYTDRGNKVICKRLIPVTEDLFTADGSESADQNTITGYIYVVRTLSKDPDISNIRKSIVKIGVTKNPVSARVANAEKDSTFLCAPVDIVSTFTLHNLNPRKVEEMLHAFFGDVRLKIIAKDRFGHSVSANEWFLVSPKTVKTAVNAIVKGELANFRFDKNTGKITPSLDKC